MLLSLCKDISLGVCGMERKTKFSIWVWIAFFFGCFVTPPSIHAQDDSDEIWEEFAQPLNPHASEGPGWTWIEEKAEESQFVLFGEQHGLVGVPQIVSLAHERLRSQGYTHLALEMSPWLGAQMSREGVHQTLTSAPYELAFSYNGMVSLLEDVEARSGDQAGVFWGLDQPVTAIHAYKRLSEILPTHRARRMALGLHLKAAAQAGRYIKSEHRKDLTRLREAAGLGISQEAEMLISSIETSMEIYLKYFAGQRGEISPIDSDQQRERFMEENLSRRLSDSATGTVGDQKAIILMGGSHIMEGIGPNGIPTVGDFAQNLAANNGQDALHIGIYAFLAGADHSPPESIFSEGDAILVDLQALRAKARSEWIEQLSPSLRRTVEQYDAAIFLTGELALSDSRSIMNGHEQRFRRDIILSVAPMLFAIVVLLTSIWPLMLAIKRSLTRGTGGSTLTPFWPWMLLIGSISLSLGLFVFQALRLLAPADSGGIASSNNVWEIFILLLAVLGLGAAGVGLKKKWWSTIGQVHFLILAIALTSLGVLMWSWNLGGMLG